MTTDKTETVAADVSAKRKRSQAFEEIEIDVSQPEPLSKKELRKRKKLGIPLDAPREATAETGDDAKKSDKSKSKEKEKESKESKAKPKTDFGVWIGNLSYSTTKDDLRRMLIEKSGDEIKSDEIVRIHMPKGRDGKRKGCAYVDFTTEECMNRAIALSETPFDGRKALIKDARVFTGSKKDPNSAAAAAAASSASATAPVEGKKPYKILFIGNLPFETKAEQLEQKFTVDLKSPPLTSFGEPVEDEEEIDITIKPVKVRMATFQDTGACKGFAFIDFRSSYEAGKVLKSIGSRFSFLGRTGVKAEFGEDRSLRHRQPKPEQQQEEGESLGANYMNPERANLLNKKPSYSDSARELRSDTAPHSKPEQQTSKPESDSTQQSFAQEPRRERPPPRKSAGAGRQQRITPGMALANSQRAKVSIVPSTGKKITFDN
ncbi:hypothetical protein BZA70DRAFT_270668 [Myxozyma melibiosi]|uniref:RRM domain-containing protein n=1 Tax=Myxozyma melibiosi TaxID=54550 RepID=A0ABR1FBF9_9ASCO